MTQHPHTSDDAAEQRRIRIGVRMTILYSIVYGGFVALSVFRPSWMGAKAILGLNLAVAYGLGLIVIAILFAMFYNYLCRTSRMDTTSHSPPLSDPQANQQEKN